jgi:hypothetical protein
MEFKIKVFKTLYPKVVQLLIIKQKIVHLQKLNFNMSKKRIEILI